MDDDVDNYDYENANDRENFCPALVSKLIFNFEWNSTL